VENQKVAFKKDGNFEASSKNNGGLGEFMSHNGQIFTFQPPSNPSFFKMTPFKVPQNKFYPVLLRSGKRVGPAPLSVQIARNPRIEKNRLYVSAQGTSGSRCMRLPCRGAGPKS
jgi:hypothetical protein